MDETRLQELSKLFKALADPARLRILGLLADGSFAGHELAYRLSLTPPTISHHIRRLVAAGLVNVTQDAQSRIYSLNLESIRTLATSTDEGNARDTNEEANSVIRAFFDGPRLRQIPAARKKRVIVLRRLLEKFELDRSYTEQEINGLLREAHDDVATLRRELVDYGFMIRDRGIYRLPTELPGRGATVRQEVGDESVWFEELVTAATARAIRRLHRADCETPSALIE